VAVWPFLTFSHPKSEKSGSLEPGAKEHTCTRGRRFAARRWQLGSSLSFSASKPVFSFFLDIIR